MVRENRLLERREHIYGVIVREWKIEDAAGLAEMLNNKNILNNLRDGLPYPYTKKDAEEYIMSMLSADKTKTFALAIH